MNQNCGKMILGIVDCTKVDSEYEHIYIAFNQGCLVKYHLESFNVCLDLGKVHLKKIRNIRILRI